MSRPFIFVDSRRSQPQSGSALPGLCCAVEKLNKAAHEGKLLFLSVSGKRSAHAQELPKLITYAVTERWMSSSSETVSVALFDVSHYIGSYSTRIPGRYGNSVVSIEINPRWGASILHYLLRYTTGIYMPPDAIRGNQAERHSAEWILVLLWRTVFNQALRRFHIPKEYRAKRTNDRFFKGRLDVHRQIRENIADQSKFCCVHSPLTIDTTINQTIRCVFRLLARNRAYAMLLNDTAGYDERLAAFGVKARDVRPEEISRIRYTRMSEGYRPLMEVGKAVIQRFGASTSDASPGESSFFIDVAEIWENYLQAILGRYLPSRYKVVNPNETGGYWLLSGERRQIRPDLLIEENGIPLAILDAKFKSYTAVGKTAHDGVSREDLFQMATYLYHFGSRDGPMLGLFVSPAEEKEDLHRVENHRSHAIGVLNFDLSQWDGESFDLKAIKAYEEGFAARLHQRLEKFRRDCELLSVSEPMIGHIRQPSRSSGG